MLFVHCALSALFLSHLLPLVFFLNGRLRRKRLRACECGELCERGPSGQRLRGATCVCVRVCVCVCVRACAGVVRFSGLPFL